MYGSRSTCKTDIQIKTSSSLRKVLENVKDYFMKVLILTNNDVGLYKFRREILEDLVQDHTVYIALPDGEFISALKELGCNYCNIEFERRGMNPFKDLKLFISYAKLISKIKPDVVLTYTIKPTIYGGIVSILKRKKYIVNITGLGTAVENPGMLQKLILLTYKFALAKASCVFFQNQSNMDFFQERNLVHSKCRLIPGSGVNIEEYKYEKYPMTEPKADKFLFVGRIMKDKGIGELLEVAEITKKTYPNVMFDIVGGLDEDYLETIHKYESKGIIKYWGPQSDVKPFYKKCNAVVLPSYHEGMANVLLEASAMGRPVLASDIPGCKEIFDEGVTGFGFREKDAEALVRRIEEFILLPSDVKTQMGRAAREKVEKEFNRQIIIDAYKKEINEMR